MSGWIEGVTKGARPGNQKNEIAQTSYKTKYCSKISDTRIYMSRQSGTFLA